MVAESEEERSASPVYARRGSGGCPLQEAGRLARKALPKSSLKEQVAGKGPSASLLPLGKCIKGSLLSLFFAFGTLCYLSVKQTLIITVVWRMQMAYKKPITSCAGCHGLLVVFAKDD